MNEDLYIRRRKERSLEYYIPELDKWVGQRLLKKTILSLGLTEELWYNDHFLPKDDNGNPIIPKCEYSKCNKQLEFIGISKGGYRKSCNITCHNRHISEDKNSYCHSTENKKIRSDRLKSLYNDPSSYLNTEEFRKHLSNFGKFSNTELSKLKRSETIKRLWNDPTSKYNTDDFRKSLVKRLKFRNSVLYYSSKMNKLMRLKSLYEMYYAEILDNNEEVNEFYYESISVNYRMESDSHKYIPDFKLITNEGYILYIEVKPSKLINDPIVQKKMSSLLEYSNNSIETSDSVFITEKDIFSSDILKSINHIKN